MRRSTSSPSAAGASPCCKEVAGRPWQGLGGLAGIGQGSPASAGAAREVAGPRGDVSLPGATGAGVSNADRVVASLRPRFRACYNQGLQQDPSMSGRLVVSVTV